MAKKRNVDAFGKSWSPIDLPNLEKAVKLYERLNYLQDHFAGSLSGSNKIMAQINEKYEISEELKKLGIKHSKEELEIIIQLLKQQQAVNNGSANVYNGRVSSATNVINRAQSITNNNGQTLSLNNAGSFIAGAAQQRYAQKQMNANFQYFQDIAKQMGRDPNSKLVSKLAENKTVNQLAGSSEKFNTAAGIIQVAANTFSAAVNTFWGLFKQGYTNQYNAYNDTFTNISVRTGMSKNQYFSNQMAANGQLSSMGLSNNVRMSDVQQMWNTLASTGMGQEKVLANAIDTVVTQTIVPYLKDTITTSQFQELLDQQPQLLRQVRGIGRATQEITGNSTFATQYLDQMLKDIAPMAQVAENELGVQFAKISGRYSELIAQGYNDAQIGEMYKLSAQVYNDPLAALRSGNIDQQLAVVNGITNGIDFRNFDQVDAETLKALNFVANLTPEGKMSPLYAGLSNTAASTWLKVFMNEKNTDIASILKAGGSVANILDLTANRTTQQFANDLNNTAKQMQETQLENVSTWLARIYEEIGYWGNIIGVLVKGIAGVVGAKIIGGIGKKLLGIGGGRR